LPLGTPIRKRASLRHATRKRTHRRAHTLACAHTRVRTHRHAHARDNEVNNNFDSHHRDNNLIAHTKAVRHRHSGGSSSGRYQPAFRPR
jgi:hypothetical protein